MPDKLDRSLGIRLSVENMELIEKAALSENRRTGQWARLVLLEAAQRIIKGKRIT